MPVQMILGDVQRYGDIGVKFGDGFKLEAGEFQHVPLVRTGAFDHGGDWRADIAAHLRGDAGFAQDVSDQRGGGGLAVGAGNADGAAEQKRRGQLHFADDARRARAPPPAAARSAGTPGEMTIKSNPSKTASSFSVVKARTAPTPAPRSRTAR
jgi:hypothetical protein